MYRVIKLCLLAILLFLIYFALGAVLPYQTHKEAQAQFSLSSYESEAPGSESVMYVEDNVQAMELRLAMIESAESRIILSTFDFDTDQAGKELLSSLYHAAERGVEIQILVDGISGFLDVQGDAYFRVLCARDNVSLKIYNPVNLLLPWKLMCRMHDKYLIVDDSMYLLGGRNSTDLFLGNYNEEHKNIDSEVFVTCDGAQPGESLVQLEDYFDSVWNTDACKECEFHPSKSDSFYAEELDTIYVELSQIYPKAFDEDYLSGLPMLEANKITLLSNPVQAENKAPQLWAELVSLMSGGEDVLIYTPYVIASDSMQADLEQICQSNQQTVMILNDVANGANPWGCVDYLNQKEELLSTGVTIGQYCYVNSLHTKNILVDDRICVIGSFNFDMRSAYLDTELMLVIDSGELNQQLREKAALDLSYCKLVTEDGEMTGENYIEEQLSGGKRIIYYLLQYAIRPFRNLLCTDLSVLFSSHQG